MGINYPYEEGFHVDFVYYRGPSIDGFRRRCVVPAISEQSAWYVDASLWRNLVSQCYRRPFLHFRLNEILELLWRVPRDLNPHEK